MHTHERTHLARLGFADPDKKNPLHDKICADIATSTNARDPHLWQILRNVACQLHGFTEQQSQSVDFAFDPEFVLRKGGKPDLMPFGFADVVVHYVINVLIKSHPFVFRGTFGIEVSTADVPGVNILRQIRLYRSSGITHWIVVCAHAMAEDATRLMEQAQIPVYGAWELFPPPEPEKEPEPEEEPWWAHQSLAATLERRGRYDAEGPEFDDANYVAAPIVRLTFEEQMALLDESERQAIRNAMDSNGQRTPESDFILNTLMDWITPPIEWIYIPPNPLPWGTTP